METARLHSGRWLVEVREVADRTAAEKLRGARLGVPREELPDLPDGGYLLHDLIGMSVCEADMTIGVIREVYDQPGAPLLALEVDGRERLVPFEAELVVELDFEAGEVHMKLPAGLLDI
jgi:16S rRNA processing protein RimM